VSIEQFLIGTSAQYVLCRLPFKYVTPVIKHTDRFIISVISWVTTIYTTLLSIFCSHFLPWENI